MRTQASYNGHPIHPMLIPYPFAFLTGAFGFTLAARATGNAGMAQVPRYLVPAGIAAGLLAAVPGIVDYVYSVPPQSSGKERATKHALLNVTALGLFTASWLIGRRNARSALSAVLQGLGAAAMSVAGYMGGTLVVRNQIGVDHRYANAGKWQEDEGTLELNQMMLLHDSGMRIAIGRTERGCAAFEDRCSHKGGPLSDGVLIAGTVQCPWHGSQFDVHTGKVTCGPATEPIAVFPTDAAAVRKAFRRS